MQKYRIASDTREYVSEDQIERAVESRTNAIDSRFMARKLSQDEYDREMKALNAWADREYKTLRRLNSRFA